MVDNQNPYTHFGKPLLGSLLAFVAIGGFLLTIGGEKFRAEYWSFVLMNVLYLTFIFFLIWLVYDTKTHHFKLPKIRAVIENNSIIICEPEEWIGYGARLNIYQKDGDYERPLALGIVSNIQANRLIQIQVVEKFYDDNEDIMAQLTKLKLSDIIVKPAQDWRAS
ncbi:hypothetical protein [Novosphingobium sp. B 225]|uniref:hypothetical protein n=1 Tax=Novosphingobium sp. B 225 TaxID=1961849 RepID=UPI001124D28B|nr:hypothetical protein [Novosphingobium sp. B 225]